MELGYKGILMVINTAGGLSFEGYRNIKFFWDIKLYDISNLHLFLNLFGYRFTFENRACRKFLEKGR